MHILRKLLFANLVCIVVLQCGWGQQNRDVKIEPDPFLESGYFDRKNTSRNIRSQTTISKGIRNNFLPDTLLREYYNDLGKVTLSYRYEKGTLHRKDTLTYNDRQQHIETQLISVMVPDKYTATKYDYYPDGRQRTIAHVAVNGGKSEPYSTSVFNYKKNNLVEKNVLNYNKTVTADSFYYLEKLLIKHSHIPKTGMGFYENVYTYNTDDLLTKRVLSFLSKEKGIPEVLSVMVYEYEDGKVVKKTDWSMGKSYSEDKPVVCVFSYDENSLLKTMQVTYDTLYRNVTFTYDNTRILAVDVITNSTNNAYLVFWVPVAHDVTGIYPVHYKEVFEYNDKKDLIGKKSYLEGGFISELQYHLEYY